MSKHSLQVRARRAGIWPCLRCVAVLIGALLAGCGGGGGDEQKADYDPPRIVWARFEPSSLGDIGGTARIIALVTDDSGVAWVRATLTRPDGSQAVHDMTWNQAGYYEVSIQAPANLSSIDQHYYASVNAADTKGIASQAVSIGPLTVRTDSAPPPPPKL